MVSGQCVVDEVFATVSTPASILLISELLQKHRQDDQESKVNRTEPFLYKWKKTEQSWTQSHMGSKWQNFTAEEIEPAQKIS